MEVTLAFKGGALQVIDENLKTFGPNVSKSSSIPLSTREILLLELQRMKLEGSLQVWIVKSNGLGMILRLDLKGLE